MAEKHSDIKKIINEALAIEYEEAQRAGALGFMARALVQATMPHKNIEEPYFLRKNGNFELSMQAHPTIGLPYGSLPRLIMAWLTTQAVQKKSRALVLGGSLSEFMRELDLVPTGGRWGTVTRLKTQVEKLFSTSVTAYYTTKESSEIRNFVIADQATLWWQPKDPGQGSLWESTVTLSEAFYNEMIQNPVPIDMRALKALKRSPMAIDAYTWLTYRMSYLNKATTIPWEPLALQFGAEYGRTRDFKAAFQKALTKIQAVYPDLKIDPNKKGLTIKPSKTHVQKLVSK